MKALILYWSAGGSTKKVADTIKYNLENNNVETEIMTTDEGMDIDILSGYDLVFLGAPSYQFIPPEPVLKYVRYNMERYQKKGLREIRSPKKKGKYGIIFCTYAGIHTGIKEGYTAGKYLAQYLEHLGFLVLDEWYVVSNFHNWDDANKKGKLGDITDRPNKNDLIIIKQNTLDILKSFNLCTNNL